MGAKLFELLMYLCLFALLAVVYFACFSVASTGYGYAGYKGYHRHHSIWYHRTYQERRHPSVRGGSGFSGKGMRGGK